MEKEAFQDLLQFLQRGHNLVTVNYLGHTFESKSQSYSIYVRPFTTVFTSKVNPDYEFVFGTDLNKIQSLIAFKGWPVSNSPALKPITSSPSPKLKLEVVKEEKAPSARGVMLEMLAKGIPDEEIAAYLVPLHLDRDPKSLKAQVGLNKKWLFSQAGAAKLTKLRQSTSTS